MGHGCGTLLSDTHTGHFCGTLYLGHSCRTLLWVTLVGSSWAWRHANALCRANPNGTATSRTSRRHTVCPDTIEANMSHDTTNHPAHQRHAAFTPACFALPSGTAPRKRTFHQGCANPNGTATSRTSRRHTLCPHTRSSHASVSHETSSKSHASRLQDGRFVRDFLQIRVKTSVSYETSSKSHTSRLHSARFVRDFL